MEFDSSMVSNTSTPATHIQPETRLLFIDNLRWLMIVFVVVMHLNVTYSGLGSWFYTEDGLIGPFSYIIFALYGSFTQAYFMGLLFFIAGFFTAASYNKKGFTVFVKDRLFRLGIPTLFFMLVLSPVIGLIEGYFYITLPSDIGLQYLHYLISFQFLGASGPLWFALALLIFSLIYGLVRMATGKQKAKDKGEFILSPPKVLAVITLISLATFLTRLVQPVGTSIFNMQLCYFSQYIILFIIGVLSQPRCFLVSLPYKTGITWFKLALIVGIPFWFVMLIAGEAFESLDPFWGGMYWQAAAYATWESFFCIGVCLGLLVIFRERFNTRNYLARFLSQNAFGVYVFHAPLLVAISLSLRGWILPPLLKMILVAIIALPVCFCFSWLIRRIPLLSRIFS